MKKTVLVVGGAGYIGSHMVLALQDAGHRAVVFDNLSRGFPDAVGSAELFVGDLGSSDDLDKCLGSVKPDLVMHFAALAYVGESVTAPEIYYDNNVVGAFNLLKAMRRHSIDKLVFSSTCATYGEPMEVPITENHPQNPINPYGRSKLMVENMLQDYARAYRMQSISLRYFNAAGCDPQGRAGERHDPESHLIPLVLAEAMRIKNGGNPTDTKLQVFGTDFSTPDGSCIRDYVHVTDICQAHLLAGARLMMSKTANPEAYNLGNGLGFSVLEVIEACRKITGQQVNYVVSPRRPGDPAKLIGDAVKAKNVLGWVPRTGRIDQIIHTAWAWMNLQKSD